MTTRRSILIAGLGLGLAAGTARAAEAAGAVLLVANTEADQTATLQAAIDDAAARGVPVELPAGVIKTGALTLRPGSVISGAGRLTRLQFIGTGAVFTAKACPGVSVSRLAIDGSMRPLGAAAALVVLDECADLEIRSVVVSNSSGNGIAITGSTGRVVGCSVSKVAQAGIFAIDSTLMISGNAVSGCGNNGVLVWRSKAAEDGSQVVNNTIAAIRADAGGTGENGNGINVFRAGSVQVSGNRITDCAYSAVRGNAASNISMTGNTCQRIGEVALYCEFGFQGAVIANNIVDGAATGVSVTNFNEGGRLAVVQGNLIRNLARREQEPEDKRGEGIAVEADTLVSGNTIEGAPTCGILLGWGRHMRDVSATGNVIRGCRIGIMVSSDSSAGSALVSGNLISGASDGAIRAHEKGRAFGADLAKGAPTTGRVTIAGNSAG
ncbi:MAG: TIGR03808 family TAT-translocated repetitive protein [Hyphomicrobiaceae bacterium]